MTSTKPHSKGDVTTQGEFKILPLDMIKKSSTNPRKHVDKIKLAELTESIKTKGVLVPVLVRPDELDGYYELVAGERRLTATRDAGLKEIPCIVRKLTDEQALEAQVIENLQREDVHPLDEAEGYHQLRLKLKLDIDTIAAKVGKSKAYIFHRLKLLELIEPVKTAFIDDHINIGHAVLLARLQPNDQKECFDKLKMQAWVSSNQQMTDYRQPAYLKAYIQHNILLNLNSAPWKKEDAELLLDAGACKTCEKRTGFHKELFSDITKDDRCTDGNCFQLKMNTFLALKEKELTEDSGKSIVKVVDEYSTNRKDALGKHDYRVAKKQSDCAHVETGLYVNGKQIGRKVYVCRDKTCTKHFESWARPSSGSSTTDYRAQEKARQKKELFERNCRIEALREIVLKTPNNVTNQFLREVFVQRLYDSLHSDELKALASFWGLKSIARSNHGYTSHDYETPIKKKIKETPDAELTQLIVTLTLIPNIPSGYKSLLPSAAKLLKVDIEKVVEKLKAEEKAKAKNNTKKTAKPSAKKSDKKSSKKSK
jgi:ParB family chromosome partitioning protein